MSAKTFETEPSEMDSDVFIENLLYLQTKSIYMKNALNILLLLFLVYLLKDRLPALRMRKDHKVSFCSM